MGLSVEGGGLTPAATYRLSQWDRLRWEIRDILCDRWDLDQINNEEVYPTVEEILEAVRCSEVFRG